MKINWFFMVSGKGIEIKQVIIIYTLFNINKM